MASKLVLDTAVMVAAFDSPKGASRKLLLAILDGKATILLSTSLLLEYEAVLTRPSILEMIGLSAGEVVEILDEIASLCRPVGFDYRWRPASTDPDDDLVLETAVNGSADAIVTFNVRDFAAAAQFGISVERPAATLGRIAR
jgi:putative PIN family toxin of toxin-antitoxin system